MVAAVSARPRGVSLFAVDGSGTVQTTYRDLNVSTQFKPWSPLSGASFPIGTSITAVSASTGGVSLFAVDGTGTVKTIYYDPDLTRNPLGQWSPWIAFSGLKFHRLDRKTCSVPCRLHPHRKDSQRRVWD